MLHCLEIRILAAMRQCTSITTASLMSAAIGYYLSILTSSDDGNLEPALQQVGRFFINTTRIAQTVSGDCWWSIPGAALGGQNRGCHAGTSSRLRRGPPLRSCASISVRDQPSILFIKKVLFELQVAARRQQNARAPRP